jgi:hypothetical protein
MKSAVILNVVCQELSLKGCIDCSLRRASSRRISSSVIHRLGCPRLYERTFRQDVAGLLLVDPTPERWPQSAIPSLLREDREVPLLAREVVSRRCDIKCPVIVLSRGRWSASPGADDDELAARVTRWTHVGTGAGVVFAAGTASDRI